MSSAKPSERHGSPSVCTSRLPLRIKTHFRTVNVLILCTNVYTYCETRELDDILLLKLQRYCKSVWKLGYSSGRETFNNFLRKPLGLINF